VFYTSSIIIDLDSFGKGIVRKRNIDWLKGALFADPRIRVGWEFMTLRSKTQPYSASGFLSYSWKMVFGKHCLRESISVRKHYPRSFENLGTRISGPV
jgi:hypothetical protein